MSRNNSSSASNPPADEPTPTMGYPALVLAGGWDAGAAFATAPFVGFLRCTADAGVAGVRPSRPVVFLAAGFLCLFMFVTLRSPQEHTPLRICQAGLISLASRSRRTDLGDRRDRHGALAWLQMRLSRRRSQSLWRPPPTAGPSSTASG